MSADFEYECAWQGLASIKFNRWIPRAELVEKGFRKFVTEFDQRLAASALGNDARPLSKESITKFLQDFGLEPEFGVHSNIRGLSGALGVALVEKADSWRRVCQQVGGVQLEAVVLPPAGRLLVLFRTGCVLLLLCCECDCFSAVSAMKYT
jgi:hypothetical protein